MFVVLLDWIPPHVLSLVCVVLADWIYRNWIPDERVNLRSRRRGLDLHRCPSEWRSRGNL